MELNKSFCKNMIRKHLLMLIPLIFLGAGCRRPDGNQTQAIEEQNRKINELTERLDSLTASSATKNSVASTKFMGRDNELQLEGFINDYFYRRRIKDPSLFSDFDAYGSVLANSIVVYVYPKNRLSQTRESSVREMIGEGLHDTILDLSDFEWAQDYSFNIVIR